MKKNHRFGFSLLEVMIVLTIIMVLMMVLIVFLDPIKQIQKIHDSQRKRDLAQTQRILEDYYNDNYYYPPGEQICHDEVVNNDGICSCHICGLSTQSELTNYIKQLFCDPENPSKQYLYQYDCINTNPSTYRVCATLTTPKENGISYNYGVASNNTTSDACLTYDDPIREIPLEPTDTPTPTETPTPVYCDPDYSGYWCYDNDHICNNCKTIEICQASVCIGLPQLYYSLGGDSSCANPCIIAE
jgi:Tfp pilus assembly protein PilE